MKLISQPLSKIAATLIIPLTFGSSALAQDTTQTPETKPSPSSFESLLKQIQEEKKEKELAQKQAQQKAPPVPNFAFPIPPVSPYQNPMPWGPNTSIFLKSNPNNSVTHTISGFACPASIKDVPLYKAWAQNETGAVVHCEYRSKGQRFVLVIDGIGGRAVDLDSMVKQTMVKAKKTPDIKSKTLSMGKGTADCRYDAAVDPKGLNVSITACHYGAYAISMLSLGQSPQKTEKTLGKLLKRQKDFIALRERCVSHINDIDNMEPSGATGRALLAESVEYEQNGPTCFFTASLSPNSEDGFNQVFYTFPENPDTPLMMTLHRDDGSLIKVFRLQHAYARQDDRDDKPAVYNLIKTTPDGTHTVYDVAYTRVLPISRFYAITAKANGGKIEEKMELRRNAAGGFDMALK